MQNTARVREILSWYAADNVGVRTNIARLLNHGRLGGTGRLVILPIDQGWEHGPARSFSKNPLAYDPRYHFELAIESGCNAYAAPLGALEAAAPAYIGEMPTILKLNNNNSLYNDASPDQAVTGSVDDALRLGCAAIGFTIYPGSVHSQGQYEEIRQIAAEAKSKGIAVVIWSYPRGPQISTAGETGIDVVSYAAHIAAQLGAHFIKVKPPTAHLDQDAAKKAYHGRPIATLTERVRDVVESCFAGRRIVIFSGGATKGEADVLGECREIAEGGGFGSIIGRNAFQRPRNEAVKLLKDIMDVYADVAARD